MWHCQGTENRAASCCSKASVVLVIFTPSVKSWPGSGEEILGINIHHKKWLYESNGKEWGREREESVRKFEKDGSGSSHKEKPPTLTTKAWVMRTGWAHGCGTRTFCWVSSPGCAGCSQSVRVTGFHRGAGATVTGVWLEETYGCLNQDLQPCREHADRAVSRRVCGDRQQWTTQLITLCFSLSHGFLQRLAFL